MIENIPKHLAIIMDGNRRFAKKSNLHPLEGHNQGAKKLTDVLNWAKEFNIKKLTLYTFSVQNFSRPKDEVEYLMKFFLDNFDKLKTKKEIFENKIKVNVIGRINMFPENVQEKIKEIMELTKDHDQYIVNFAMGYGGREEIIDTAKTIAQKVKNNELDIKDINEEIFEKNLYLNDFPDLIIRTGNEKRLSNFLTYQSAYSELIFLDKMWPEIQKNDFVMCLEEYSNRKRRFGK